MEAGDIIRDRAARDEWRGGTGAIDPAAAGRIGEVSEDLAVHDRRRGREAVNATPEVLLAVLNRKTIDDRFFGLTAGEGHDSPGKRTIEYRHTGPLFTPEGDVLAGKIDDFRIESWSHEDEVPIHGRIDSRLNSRLVGRDADRGGKARVRSESEKHDKCH